MERDIPFAEGVVDAGRVNRASIEPGEQVIVLGPNSSLHIDDAVVPFVVPFRSSLRHLHPHGYVRPEYSRTEYSRIDSSPENKKPQSSLVEICIGDILVSRYNSLMVS